MSEPVVYLAGPVAHVEDGGAGWREEIIDRFDDCEFRDPLSKYNVPVEGLSVVDGMTDPDDHMTVGVAELVEGDKELLRESNAVLVGYRDVQSIGTPMEVMWAREREYPVALWLRDGTRTQDLSPWYRYHATAIVRNPESALAHIQAGVEIRAQAGGVPADE